MNTMTDNLLNTSNFEKINNNEDTNYTVNSVHSLFQGKDFTNYQDKIKNKYGPSIENFSNNVTLPRRLDTNVLNKSYDTTLYNYDTNINKYDKISKQIQVISENYIKRTDPNNRFLNKIIRFNTGELCYVTNQGVAKQIDSPTILKSISSKNGCPDTSRGYIDINIPWMQEYKIEGSQIPTNPPLIMGKKMRLNESCGYQGSNIYVNSMLPNDDPSENYVGCYQDTQNAPTMAFIGEAPPADGSRSGKYTLNQCKDAAIREGKQYYALQSVNPDTLLGYCATGNDLNKIKSNGEAYSLQEIWSSKTAGTPATHAKLTQNGTLDVRDDSNNIYFNSTNGTFCNQVYSIDYNTDSAGNDIGKPQTNVTINQCKTLCENRKECTGFVWDSQNKNRCWLKSGRMKSTGKSNMRNINRKTVETEDCKYVLNMNTDNNGTMPIYKGTAYATDNVFVWAPTLTDSSTGLSNPKYVASRGKFGVPFLKTNDILYKGDWVSSVDGSLLLRMENNGNLVLYKFILNCKKNTSGTKSLYYGNQLSNAVYDLGKDNVGVKSNMGTLAYVDADSRLYPYPNNNITYSNTYGSTMDNTNINGYDISGPGVSNVSIDKCMEVCNTNKNCNAFVYNTNGPNPICVPKNIPDSVLYSSNNLDTVENSSIYIRDKKPLNTPEGINPKVFNINSIAYNNYDNTRNPPISGGLANFIAPQKRELSNLQKQINMLSSDLGTNVDSIQERVLKPIEGFEGSRLFYENVKEIDSKKNKINGLEKMMPNVDNMLNDTNIVVLQENYSYMLWSILALATVVVAVKLKNSQ
jgi:hypothetical protein